MIRNPLWNRPSMSLLVGCGILLGLISQLSADERLKQIEVAAGFEVQIVAAEPLVQDPVDFDWSPDGRLWVVEMADYPLGIHGDQKPGGRVRVLEDRDGDGVYDHSTLFADRLSTPNGILCWKQGVLVTAAPDVVYLEDTSGDGRADKRQVLYTGFGEGNQQHRVNGLRWGLDNWVYLANGDSGGTIVSSKTGETVELRGRDLRIRPDSGALELQSGQTQYGRNRDDWGNWFGCNNPNPIFHYVLDEHYLTRNPHLTFPAGRHDIRRGDTRVYPIGPIISHCDPQYRAIGATPRFTSACGTMIYRDNLFGPDYQNVSFTSEPVYNIVHARKLVPRGVTFESHKLQAETEEFFRSADPWSRPACIRTGPDGGLYIADMVREVIEHPQWIDDELEKTLDVRSGSRLGRIYRVVPQASPLRNVPRLDRMTTAELVQVLESSNGSQRDLAQRLLLWQSDPQAASQLRRLYETSPRPLARLHALCTLEGLAALPSPTLLLALDDAHPGIRRHAVRILESQWAHWDDAEQAAARRLLESRAADQDPMVRLQVAYSLGEIKAPWTGKLLAALLATDGEDPWLRAAILSSVHPGNLPVVTESLLADSAGPSVSLAQLMVMASRVEQTETLESILSRLSSEPQAWQTIHSWFRSIGPTKPIEQFGLSPRATAALDRILDRAKSLLEAAESSTAEKTIAVELLGYQSEQTEQDVARLESLLTPAHATALQIAAIDRLSQLNRQQTVPRLAAHWKFLSPQIRSHALSVILQNPQSTEDLLSSIQGGKIAATSLSAEQRMQLLKHRSEAIRQLATEVLQQHSQDRQAVVEAYSPAIALFDQRKTDLEQGRRLFETKCSSCHRLENRGHDVGPNLERLTNRSPKAILTAVLDPNRAVEAKYLQYQAVTLDGIIFTGKLSSESENSITLIASDGKTHELLRSDIETLQCSNESMMPVGLEEGLSVEQIASLIHYVVNTITPQAEPKERSGTDEPAR
ncbi:PVC-type heme-binding CxxCH protein [Roseimaritima ulvae]|uniref:Cytochrome c n=1 Tax=Roseimaritima ulvae TaxID=980254 RepID=A0A5B9R2Z9_9BACT|nr:PVC-type heme-binding CxxCH protein [Roseimaritima ulvae]QEG43836.1 Cytochrome c [Roseimaritima ulvae]